MTVIFTGRVQGVGFRYTTLRVAQRFEVTGYVKNLPDWRRVELVAEGLPDVLALFLEAVKDAMSGYITKAEEERQPATGQFKDFRVAY
jgi:acylphosphatase